jgi:hypothetical protein
VLGYTSIVFKTFENIYVYLVYHSCRHLYPVNSMHTRPMTEEKSTDDVLVYEEQGIRKVPHFNNINISLKI